MEKRELEIFKHLKNDIITVFDVGARTDLDYYNLHKNCDYHLFEPNIQFVNELKNKISLLPQDHKIRVNQFGLSDIVTENAIYYDNVQSFIKNPLVGGQDSGSRYNLSTIDKYVIDNEIDRINFLKIDTEGLDHMVLRGAQETINSDKIDYIQLEYWDKPDYFYQILGSKYDMYLILENEIFSIMSEERWDKDHHRIVTPPTKIQFKDMDFTIKIDQSVVKFIFENLITRGMGGNIFCINKSLNR